MKVGFILMLALILAALAANFLLQDNGYVLINFRGWTIEMSVPVLLFFFCVSYLLLRLLRRIWIAPRQLGEAAGRIRGRRAGQQITRGYIELAKGNFARGERMLTRGVRNSETPLLNYLAAARAAQMQGDRERRDTWLKMAYEQTPEASSAVLLTQAELQLANDELEGALATLKKIQEDIPRNAETLRMMAQVYLRQEEWRALSKLIPQLIKKARMPEAQVTEMAAKAFSGVLVDPSTDKGTLDRLWRSIPRSMRGNTELVIARAQALARLGEVVQAEKIIKKQLAHEWDDRLVKIYGELDVSDLDAHLKRVERWLGERPEDALLLLVTGRLCIRNELWGKARSYLESSIAIRPSPQAWHELGQLMAHVGEADAASEAFREGLAMSYAASGSPRLEQQMLDN
ncbi:MAG: heme biosynthesis HemY N-terminal domain-containing protein [Gammaproteobacteria bacterium]